MISVVIPTFNAARTLPGALEVLVGAALDGLVKDVLIVDGGSTDATLEIADDAGARILEGQGIAAACAAARGDWLLLLAPGTRLAAGWETAVARHLAGGWERAAHFRVSRDGRRPSRWLAEVLRLPLRGDEGLLISKRLYDEVGGGGGRELLTRLRWRVRPVEAFVCR